MNALDLEVLKSRRQGMSGLVAAVADIHGCFQAARTAINVIETLGVSAVFLGDYIDRGPSSHKTIDILMVAKKEHPDWTFLLGNHEQMLLEAIETVFKYKVAPRLGAAAEYLAAGKFPREHEFFLRCLETFKEMENLLFVHGGIQHYPHLPVQAQPLQELLWSYEISPDWRGKKIVRGHEIVRTPTEHRTHISLNTGCGCQGPLTVGIVQDTPEVSNRLLGYFQISEYGTLIRHSNLQSPLIMTHQVIT